MFTRDLADQKKIDIRLPSLKECLLIICLLLLVFRSSKYLRIYSKIFCLYLHANRKLKYPTKMDPTKAYPKRRTRRGVGGLMLTSSHHMQLASQPVTSTSQLTMTDDR